MKNDNAEHLYARVEYERRHLREGAERLRRTAEREARVALSPVAVALERR